MSKRLTAVILATTCVAGIAWPQHGGFVLKRGEGESYFGGNMIIKASPRSGSQSAEMIWQSLSPGSSTGRHIHHEVDEFFYVIAGRGWALVGDREVQIEAGDIVFVPRGAEHRLRPVGTTSALEIVFLVDKPGLADDIREGHARAQELGRDLTLDELNEIAERHGTTYLSLE